MFERIKINLSAPNTNYEKTDENDEINEKSNDNENTRNLISVLTTNFVVIGLVFIVFGKDIKEFFINMRAFNEFQILGFLFTLLGLILYCVYLISKFNEKEYTFVKVLLLISITTLLFQIVIFSIGDDMNNAMQLQWYVYSLGLLTLINIVIAFALFEYFLISVISIIFRKTFNFFKQSTERISVILGFFGTLIALIIKLLN